MKMHAAPAQQITAYPWANLIRSSPRIAFLLICLAASHVAAAEVKDVYVAGRGVSLEQAFGNALKEVKGEKRNFWVVATGTEATRLTKDSAEQRVLRSLNAVRERGGVVYACRADLLRAGVKDDDLLDGVASIYGYGAQEWAGLLPVRKTAVVLPKEGAQAQLILATCSGDSQATSGQ